MTTYKCYNVTGFHFQVFNDMQMRFPYVQTSQGEKCPYRAGKYYEQQSAQAKANKKAGL